MADLPEIKAEAAGLGFNVAVSDLLPDGIAAFIYCPPPDPRQWLPDGSPNPNWVPLEQRTVILRNDRPEPCEGDTR